MKRMLALFLAIVLSLSVTACGQSNTKPQQESVTETQQESTALQEQETEAAVFPVTVTDQAGRTVTIEKEPKKIVSGYYISTSLLIALGQKEKLVGIEAKAAERPIYTLSAPELIDLPNVGTAKEFDMEGCAALEPDLVILPLKLKDSVETLESLGITVILVNPENQELLTEMIELVSEATGSQEEATKLLDYTEQTENDLAETLSDVEKPTVYLAGNSSLLSTAGSDMYQSSMIALAGGSNVADEITDTYWVDIDYEQLLAWDPEYIILASDAEYTCDDVKNDPNLASCQAVVNGNVYQMPGDAEAWDSPVPSGILGSVWLASVLHPEQMSEENCNRIIEEYYETFYDFSYSEK